MTIVDIMSALLLLLTGVVIGFIAYQVYRIIKEF